MLVKRIIEERLGTTIESISSLSGGDINEVYLVNCGLGQFVIKYNSSTRFPKMFYKEAEGLNALRDSKLITPVVVDHFEHMEDQFLVLEYVKEEKKEKKFWTNFAESLSVLHQKTSSSFGFGQDNYIGSLKQPNAQMSHWVDFFVSKRLKPLVRMAFDKKLMDKKHLIDFDEFYKKLFDLLPVEEPSLLHGDLWAGNLLCNFKQQAVFIDPAVYYGHREVDIAMTKMFGGFDPAYLYEYDERFPLTKGWQERIPIHNLYPHLVHLVLFGSSYLRGIENVLERYH